MNESICNYTWTTDNGFTFHHCPLNPGHSGNHSCWVDDCLEESIVEDADYWDRVTATEDA